MNSPLRPTLFCALTSLFILVLSGASQAATPFSVRDYLDVKRISELSLSSDGEFAAFVVETNGPDADGRTRAVYVIETKPDSEPLRINQAQSGRNFAWIPDSDELAFLADKDGTTQVFSVSVKTGEFRQHTFGEHSATTFSFSQAGNGLLWISRYAVDSHTSERFQGYYRSPLHDQLSNGTEGRLLNPQYTVLYHFLDQEWPDSSKRMRSFLSVKTPEGSPSTVIVPGDPTTAYWAPDGSKISVTYVSADLPVDARSARLSSIGIYQLADRSFVRIANATPQVDNNLPSYFVGGEWNISSDGIFLRQYRELDPWVSTTEWAQLQLSELTQQGFERIEWRSIDMYGADQEPAFLPSPDNQIYSLKTVSGRKTLFEITQEGISKSTRLGDAEKSVSMLSFSSDYNSAVFVQESLTSPPQIHFWRIGAGEIVLAKPNGALAGRVMPEVKEVSWEAPDGKTINGWLFTPPTQEPLGEEPIPLLTFVHGGPGAPFSNLFSPYMVQGGGYWPHPLEVYALNGIAVFVPNYRGTHTFGTEHAKPATLDGTPVTDIVSGIENLIARNIADPERLAIAGHSHGAWLAPLVMTKTKARLTFAAASFAEGSTSAFLNYSLMSGWLNEQVHDEVYGTSVYKNPERYIELSPELHFEGLDTAVLFEAGAKSLALAVMSGAKAAGRAGLPTEFYVYPRTGHNIREPSLMVESADRNLDWFRFWLLNLKDSAPSKETQFLRWEALRRDQFPNKP